MGICELEKLEWIMNVVGYLPPKLMYLNFIDLPFLEGWLIFEIASSSNLFSLEVVNEDLALILVSLTTLNR